VVTNRVGFIATHTITISIVADSCFANFCLTDLIADGFNVIDAAPFSGTISFQTGPSSTTIPISLEEVPQVDDIFASSPPASSSFLTAGYSGSRTQLFVNISDLISSRNLTSVPFDSVTGAVKGPNRITITFTSVILDVLRANGEPLWHGQTLSSAYTVTGVVHNCFFSPSVASTLVSERAASSSLKLQSGALTQSIYAINNVRCPCVGGVRPSQPITFLIGYTLPQSDVKDLKIEAYLPFPFLLSSGMNVSSLQSSTPSLTPPSNNRLSFASTETFYSLNSRSYAPDVALIDGNYNGFRFSYATFNDTQNRNTVVGLLYTTSVTDSYFPDGYTIDALVTSTEFFVGEQSKYSTFIVEAPRLTGTHRITSANATDVTIDASGVARVVEAGDVLQVALVISNRGSSTGYDITASISLPPFFGAAPNGLNLNCNVSFSSNSTDLSNIIVGITNPLPVNFTFSCTYQIIALQTLPMETSVIGPARITRYSAVVGGFNYIDSAPLTYNAQIVSKTASASCAMISSDLSTTTLLTDIAKGETAVLRYTLTLPSGSPPTVAVSASKPTALNLVNATYVPGAGGSSSSIVSQGQVIASVSAQLASYPLGLTLSSVRVNPNNGGNVTLDFAVIANVNHSNSNNAAVTINPSLTANFGSTSLITSCTLRMVEPNLGIALTSTGGPFDGGDTASFSFTIRHLNSNADAFAVNVTLTLPSVLTINPSSITFPGASGSGNILTVFQAWKLRTTNMVIPFTANFSQSVFQGATYVATATGTYRSTNLTSFREYPLSATANIGPTKTMNTTLLFADANYSSTSLSLVNKTSQIGILEYLITRIAVPEGISRSMRVNTTLPSNIGLVALAGISTSTAEVSFTNSAAISGATLSANFLSVNLGNVTNLNTNNNIAEFVEVLYRVTLSNRTVNVANTTAAFNSLAQDSGANLIRTTNGLQLQNYQPDLNTSLSLLADFVGRSATLTLNIVNQGVGRAFNLTATPISLAGHTFGQIVSVIGSTPTVTVNGSSYSFFWANGLNPFAGVSVTYTAVFVDPLLVFGRNITANVSVTCLSSPLGNNLSPYDTAAQSRLFSRLSNSVTYRVNTPPQLRNDVFFITRPTSFSVILNDTDLENNMDLDTLSIIVPPTIGVAGVRALEPGTISYVPPPGSNTTTTLVYRICDAMSNKGLIDEFCANATVTLILDVPAPEAPPGIVYLDFLPVQDVGTQNCWSQTTMDGQLLYTHPRSSGACAFSVMQFDFSCYPEFLTWQVSATIDMTVLPYANTTSVNSPTCI